MAVCFLIVLRINSLAATLNGSFTPVPQGTNINLTAEGKLDWVHWGLHADSSLNRKATVPPQIQDFVVVYNTNITWSTAYQYADNYNGYTWFDGTQVNAVTNTLTGIYVVGGFNPTDTNGLVFTVPADTALKTLKVYVGTYAARGRLTASLSDHPASYSDTSLNNFRNGPGGVYAINFAANSPNQTLTVRWSVMLKNQADGNVTLQAATLSSSAANSPPFAGILSPAPDHVLTTPGDVTIVADALDPDGAVAKVEFYRNGLKAGESITPPYSLTLTGLPPGRHRVAAVPTETLGATSSSRPIDLFVHAAGGILDATVSSPPGSVDLTIEGNANWAHWGFGSASDFNRKASVPMQVGNIFTIGTNVVQQAADFPVAVSWSDGMPVNNVSGTTKAAFISGITNGFQFSVAARTNVQTLKVYVGMYGGAARFRAWLSDFSAPAFSDGSLTNAWGSSFAVYTINYAAASAGQALLVDFVSEFLVDEDYGNVSLSSATLNGVAPVFVFGAAEEGGLFSFSFPTVAGRTYAVYYTDSLPTANWQPLTIVTGSGSIATVTDDSSHPLRFYRVETY